MENTQKLTGELLNYLQKYLLVSNVIESKKKHKDFINSTGVIKRDCSLSNMERKVDSFLNSKASLLRQILQRALRNLTELPSIMIFMNAEAIMRANNMKVAKEAI